MEKDGKGTDLGNVIQIDDERVRDDFRRIVRGTVEETLNAKPRPIGCATQNVTSARRQSGPPSKSAKDSGHYRSIRPQHEFQYPAKREIAPANGRQEALWLITRSETPIISNLLQALSPCLRKLTPKIERPNSAEGRKEKECQTQPNERQHQGKAEREDERKETPHRMTETGRRTTNGLRIDLRNDHIRDRV